MSLDIEEEFEKEMKEHETVSLKLAKGKQDSEDDKDDHAHLEHGAEAINTLAVIGSLMFGFGISIWFDDKKEMFVDNRIAYIFYQILLSSAIGCSGFVTVSMTAHYYAVRLYLQSIDIDEYNAYMSSTHFVRVWSRYGLILCFVFFYGVMSVYIYVVNGVDDGYDIVGSVASSIIYMFVMILSLYVVYHSFSSQLIMYNVRRVIARKMSEKKSKDWDKKLSIERITYATIRRRVTTRPEEFDKKRAPDEIWNELIKYIKNNATTILPQIWAAALGYDTTFYLDAFLYCAVDIYGGANKLSFFMWRDLRHSRSFQPFADWLETKINIAEGISQKEFCENFITRLEAYCKEIIEMQR
eukprot:119773_1